MKSEAELRDILADLVLYDDLHPGNPFTAGMASMLSYVLQVPDRCGVAGCHEDHDRLRDNGLATIRKKAAKVREQRTAQEKASRQ